MEVHIFTQKGISARIGRSKHMDHTLKTIYDRREGDKAVFITPYGQEIFWPLSQFEEPLESGQVKYIALCDAEDVSKATSPTSQTAEKTNTQAQSTLDQNIDKQELAKRMLEELLNGE